MARGHTYSAVIININNIIIIHTHAKTLSAFFANFGIPAYKLSLIKIAVLFVVTGKLLYRD